jgi:hypothetical protein
MEAQYISITLIIQVDFKDRYKMNLGISSLPVKGTHFCSVYRRVPMNSRTVYMHSARGLERGRKANRQNNQEKFKREDEILLKIHFF